MALGRQHDEVEPEPCGCSCTCVGLGLRPACLVVRVQQCAEGGSKSAFAADQDEQEEGAGVYLSDRICDRGCARRGNDR